MNSNLKIKVTIADRVYPLTIRNESEEEGRQGGQYVTYGRLISGTVLQMQDIFHGWKRELNNDSGSSHGKYLT